MFLRMEPGSLCLQSKHRVNRAAPSLPMSSSKSTSLQPHPRSNFLVLAGSQLIRCGAGIRAAPVLPNLPKLQRQEHPKELLCCRPACSKRLCVAIPTQMILIGQWGTPHTRSSLCSLVFEAEEWGVPSIFHLSRATHSH